MVQKRATSRQKEQKQPTTTVNVESTKKGVLKDIGNVQRTIVDANPKDNVKNDDVVGSKKSATRKSRIMPSKPASPNNKSYLGSNWFNLFDNDNSLPIEVAVNESMLSRTSNSPVVSPARLCNDSPSSIHSPILFQSSPVKQTPRRRNTDKENERRVAESMPPPVTRPQVTDVVEKPSVVKSSIKITKTKIEVVKKKSQERESLVEPLEPIEPKSKIRTKKPVIEMIESKRERPKRNATLRSHSVMPQREAFDSFVQEVEVESDEDAEVFNRGQKKSKKETLDEDEFSFKSETKEKPKTRAKSAAKAKTATTSRSKSRATVRTKKTAQQTLKKKKMAEEEERERAAFEKERNEIANYKLIVEVEEGVFPPSPPSSKTAL